MPGAFFALVSRMPKTSPATQEPNSLPNPELLKGKADFLTEYVGLPFNIHPPSWMYTDRLLEYTLRRVTSKVDLIALGPLTNLAHFLQESPLLFERKVKRIYFSGGEARDGCKALGSLRWCPEAARQRTRFGPTP